jgi:hypothetical protein
VDVEDLMQSPAWLEGRSLGELRSVLTFGPTWTEERLGDGTHEGQGWLLRERTATGNITAG